MQLVRAPQPMAGAAAAAVSGVQARTEQQRQARAEAEREVKGLHAEDAQLEQDLAEAEAQIAEALWSLDYREGIGDAQQLAHEPPQVTTAAIERGNDLMLAPVYENQRRSLVQVFGGADFSAANLLSAERPEWTDASSGAPSERARLPAGWHWVVEVGARNATDAEGWQYAWNFWTQGWSPSPSAAFGQTAWVRRRKWIPALKSHALLRLSSQDLATPAGHASPAAPRHHTRTVGSSRRLSASSRQRRPDASAARHGFYCVVEVVAARGLRPSSRRRHGSTAPVVAPAIFRLTLGDQVYQSALQPIEPTANPVWAEQQGDACRHLFHLRMPVSAEGGLDGMETLILEFAHPRTGVKVRDRIYLGGTAGLPKSHPSTFVGSKAVNWLTGLHRRGHTGPVPAETRQAAIEICQAFLEKGWIHSATTTTAPASAGGAFLDSSSKFYRISEAVRARAVRAAVETDASALVVEILDAELAPSPPTPTSAWVPPLSGGGLSEAKDESGVAGTAAAPSVVPESAVLGRCTIPASTLCHHAASEGYHNLEPPDMEMPAPLAVGSVSVGDGRGSRLTRGVSKRRTWREASIAAAPNSAAGAMAEEGGGQPQPRAVLERGEVRLAWLLLPANASECPPPCHSQSDCLPRLHVATSSLLTPHSSLVTRHSSTNAYAHWWSRRVGNEHLVATDAEGISPSEHLARKAREKARSHGVDHANTERQRWQQQQQQPPTLELPSHPVRQRQRQRSHTQHVTSSQGVGVGLAGPLQLRTPRRNPGTPVMQHGEDSSRAVNAHGKVDACRRMARQYLDAGSLVAAEACINTGLSLAPHDHVLLRLQDESHFRAQMSPTHLPTPTVAVWAPALVRRDSPATGPKASVGRYRLHSLYDRMTPWVRWEGYQLAGGKFLDEYGFVILPHSAHAWGLGHSHALCLAARARPHWQRILTHHPTRLSSTTVTAATASALPGALTTALAWSHGGSCGEWTRAWAEADDETVRQLVHKYGVPPELRAQVWPQLAGATARRAAAQLNGVGLYDSLVRKFMSGCSSKHREQIEKDVARTLGGHCTACNSPTGGLILTRILGALSELDPYVGYCQSLNEIVAHLLIVLEDEETAFWVLVQVVQVIVPEYYNESLGGLSADAAVLSQLGERFIPTASAQFEEAGVPTALVAARWLLPLCAQSLPPPTLYRLWDLVLLERSSTPILSAALTIMRGVHADALEDFESAMRVLVDGATQCWDSQPFIEHVQAYSQLVRDFDTEGRASGRGSALHQIRWQSLSQDALYTHLFSTLLSATLPRQRQRGQSLLEAVTCFDRWQLFRVTTPWLVALDAEMQQQTAEHYSDDQDAALFSSLSQRATASAVIALLPGLRRQPLLLGRLLAAMAHGDLDPSLSRLGGVTLRSWLTALAALWTDAADAQKGDLILRMCGGESDGARKEAVVHFLCGVYDSLRATTPIGGSGSHDILPPMPDAAAVEESVDSFFYNHWSGHKSGRLSQKALSRLLKLTHPLVWESLTWDSPLLLGIPLPELAV